MLGLNFCFFVEWAKQQLKRTCVETNLVPNQALQQPTNLVAPNHRKKICQTWTIEEAKDYYEAKASRVFIFMGTQYTHAEESNV